jgi:hypothetical protein
MPNWIRGNESYFPKANRMTSLSAAVVVFFCHNSVRIFRRSEVPSPIVLLNSNDDFIDFSDLPAPVFDKQYGLFGSLVFISPCGIRVSPCFEFLPILETGTLPKPFLWNPPYSCCQDLMPLLTLKAGLSFTVATAPVLCCMYPIAPSSLPTWALTADAFPSPRANLSNTRTTS